MADMIQSRSKACAWNTLDLDVNLIGPCFSDEKVVASRSDVASRVHPPMMSAWRSRENFVDLRFQYHHLQGDAKSEMIQTLRPDDVRPSSTLQRVWAVGNDATCTFLRWCTQLAFNTVWYNTLLSAYYFLTVRCGMSPQRFAQRWERPLHLSTAVFSLTKATVGASLDWYSEYQISQGGLWGPTVCGAMC